ncbi:hypothetical protein C8J57DRAFT_1235755 [Mycena rebaudengoi]|nr:hypothetical protein C8J57DRAFT_1235755 [Mycena rebaudengoi]
MKTIRSSCATRPDRPPCLTSCLPDHRQPRVSFEVLEEEEKSDDEVTTWQGGVSHHIDEWFDYEWEWDDEDLNAGRSNGAECEEEDDVVVEVDGEELLQSFQLQMESETETIKKLNWTDLGMLEKKDWTKAEKSLGRAVYTKGQPAPSTERRHRADARKKVEKGEKMRKIQEAASFIKYFGVKLTDNVSPSPCNPLIALPLNHTIHDESSSGTPVLNMAMPAALTASP